MADESEIDRVLAQYGPRPLPDVRPQEMRTPPLGQSNLFDRTLSVFGQPAVDATREGLEGRRTPSEVAWTYLTEGPLGPLGSVRGPAAARIPHPITAYHGSPHDFDAFRMDRIGTGEGAQAYGHGLYFAENEGVARGYRDRLAGDNIELRNFFVGERPIDSAAYAPRVDAAIAAARPFVQHPDHARAVARNIIDNLAELEGRPASEYLSVYSAPQGWERAYEAAAKELGDIRYQHNPGRMYEVNLHARPEQFLDWERPLAEQPDIIQRMAREADLSHLKPGNRHRVMMERFRTGTEESHNRTLGHHFYNSISDYGAQGTPDLTAQLTAEGIPGIRYLDQGSRGSGQGTANYVVFNPEIIEIMRKYGIAAPVAGATTADILSLYGGGEPSAE